MTGMKGQQEILTSVVITGVLVGIVGTVLFWGLPLIQKSRDASVLENAEGFMKTLSGKIKFVANNGGKEQLFITVPGNIRFLPDGSIQLLMNTQGTIYSTDAEIPLGRNECSRAEGVWSVHDPEVLCLTSRGIGTNKYLTTYRLGHILLRTEGVASYKISMTGQEAGGGEGRTIAIENLGTIEDGNLISTLVSISIV